MKNGTPNLGLVNRNKCVITNSSFRDSCFIAHAMQDAMHCTGAVVDSWQPGR